MLMKLEMAQELIVILAALFLKTENEMRVTANDGRLHLQHGILSESYGAGAGFFI